MCKIVFFTFVDMIQTVVTPKKEDFDMSVSLPSIYVGKKVHVLFYIEDEVQKAPASVSSIKKPSDFFGILTKEEGCLLYTSPSPRD